MNRRQALGALGAVSLSGLLAAGGSDDETIGSVTTTEGTTTSVETKTTTTAATTSLTAERFDSAATCQVATELTEGPYYFDVDSIRSDIREDREGTLLRLGVRVRGAQATNGDGIVDFRTVYPGWYRGRTTHIHAKVHLDKTTLLTTQFFTNQEFDEKIYAGAPYSEDTGRATFNDGDDIYVDGGELTLSMDGDDAVGLITLDVTRS